MDKHFVIDGKYEVEGRLGQGSSSEVFLVRKGQDELALKLVKKHSRESDAELARDFKNEFSILKKLNDPHIASIFDFGHDPKRGVYFTSEYIAGTNLYHFTEGKDPSTILELFVQCLRALNYLHAYRTYHLDIKASNILVTGTTSPQIKIIDFGLAAVNPRARLAGTPAYMAPEIIRQSIPDGRADIYSLGVLFYQCFTRSNPFASDSINETLHKQLTLTAPRPSSLRKDLPRFLDEILLRMLAKNPSSRYQTSEEILRQINLHTEGRFPIETGETLLSYLPSEGRFIGRQQIIKQINEQLEHTFGERDETAKLIILSGDCGTGKTRLLQEIRHQAGLNNVVVYRLATSINKEVLSDDLQTILQDLREDARPMAILIDDLDTMIEQKEVERNVLGLLRKLQFTQRTQPVFFIGTCTHYGSLSDDLKNLIPLEEKTHIQLKPFSKKELAEYVLSLTFSGEPPKLFLEQLWDRSGGNPLITTEILRSLIEQGVLFDSRGQWKPNAFEYIGVDFSKAKISDILEQLLLGRIKRLSPDQHHILEILAVAATPLSFNRLLTVENSQSLHDDLVKLQHLDLITRNPHSGLYSFTNITLAELLYKQLQEERNQFEILKKQFHQEATDANTSTPLEDSMNNPYAYILKINQHINAEMDLDFVLKNVLYYALEIASAESGAILLMDPAGLLEVKTFLNLKDPETTASFSRTIAQQAIVSGQEIITHDAQTDDRFSDQVSIASLELKSVLCIPVHSKKQTIGALYLENRYRKHAFKNLDCNVLSAFADQVGIAIQNAQQFETFRGECDTLKVQVSELSDNLEHIQSLVPELKSQSPYKDDGIISQSKIMNDLFVLMDKVADTDLSVYIFGESGTGKELVARGLHRHSHCKDKPFVAVNCGAIPDNLMESELFGHKAGAFTGAQRDKKGLVEEADGGTLFLDEISELGSMLQVKLLRFLQEGEFRRIGDPKLRQVKVRIISASNLDIERAVKEDHFREDLYYRLCDIRLNVPVLRERPEDIPLLVDYFLPKSTITPQLMKYLLEYSWPGNVRELENLMRVATALAENGVIDVQSIPNSHPISRFIQSHSELAPQEQAVSIDAFNRYNSKISWYDYERLIVAKSFASNQQQIRATAEMLGIPEPTLYKKIKKWNLKDPNNTFIKSSFNYTQGKKIAEYQSQIFQAALTYSNKRPYAAIKQLDVSPGYYYKIMKQL